MMTSTAKAITEPNDTNGTVARTLDQAMHGAHKAIYKASGAAHPVVDRLAASAHEAVAKLAGGATQAAAALDVKGGQLREAQTRLVQSCRGQVRDKPLTAVGIAVAAGFLLSWSLSRR
jgi:ElaB/YqjD/DUF883 family membrane-anchored ribosome-binding protein